MSLLQDERGVTLIEMMVVVALIGLVVAVSFPSVTSGVDSVRMNAATGATASFFNAGLNRAERRRELLEVIVSIEHNNLQLLSAEPGFTRTLAMPEGVRILKIYPEVPGLDEKARHFVLFPGGAVPDFGIELVNQKGTHRIVRVDPITGTPQVSIPAEGQS